MNRAALSANLCFAVISTSALLITGCAVGPDYARPTLEMPEPLGAVAAPTGQRKTGRTGQPRLVARNLKTRCSTPWSPKRWPAIAT
jgi:hypothetical protein